MSDPASVIAKLEGLSVELDELSRGLADCERKIEPAEKAYNAWIEDYEAKLWDDSLTGEVKFPPEKLRERMALRAMDASLRESFSVLSAKRRRMEKRISSLKSQVDAQRSILSALKVEQEALR